MAAQLNNEEKKVYGRVIKEMIQEDKNVSSVKIVFYLRTHWERRRHHQILQYGFVKRMRKIIEEKTSCKHCQTVCSAAKKNFSCKDFVPIHIEDK